MHARNGSPQASTVFFEGVEVAVAAVRGVVFRAAESGGSRP